MPNVPIAKYPLEEKMLLVGEPLRNGVTTTFRNLFPVGKGAGETWERIRMIIRVTTATAAMTTFDEAGMYKWIKRVLLKTSDGETIVDIPGTALYHFNRWNEQANPTHDNVTAANGVFMGVLDIPFAYYFLRKPEDGYLDSGAYSDLTLQITTGAVPGGAIIHDMGTFAATTTQTATIDISVIRTKAGMFDNQAVKPLFVPYLINLPSITPTDTNANFRGGFPIESSPDLGLFGFIIKTGVLSVTAGVNGAFNFHNGTISTETDSINGVTFGDNVIPNLVDNKQLDSFRLERHRDFREIYPFTAPAAGFVPSVSLIGTYHHCFVRDGSIYSAYPTGNKSQIRLWWNAGTAGQQADCILYGFRTKRRLY